MDITLVDSDHFAPESEVQVVCEGEKNPHRSFHSVESFKNDEEVKLFAEKSRDVRSAEEWLDWWLEQKLPSIGNISPKEAILAGDFKLVMLRVRQSLRSTERLKSRVK